MAWGAEIVRKAVFQKAELVAGEDQGGKVRNTNSPRQRFPSPRRAPHLLIKLKTNEELVEKIPDRFMTSLALPPV